MARVSQLVARLTAGLNIDDDIRLRSIIETLTHTLQLTPTNIASLTESMSPMSQLPCTIPSRSQRTPGTPLLFVRRISSTPWATRHRHRIACEARLAAWARRHVRPLPYS
ncbi:HTH domain-containing protein [Clavibacter michiganensis subsp. insidiosus]|uniref:HTH domain-containing protein n=1 Tax=Clavibacter michiganensis TaxID=28447 RepID=UPI003607DC83